MIADEWIDQRGHFVVLFEVYAPEIRERDNRIYAHLQTATNISDQMLILGMLSPFVDGYFEVGVRPFLFENTLIAEGKLFFIEKILNMRHISFIISADAADVIINNLSLVFLLDGLDCKLVKIYFIWGANIKSVEIFAEL